MNRKLICAMLLCVSMAMSSVGAVLSPIAHELVPTNVTAMTNEQALEKYSFLGQISNVVADSTIAHPILGGGNNLITAEVLYTRSPTVISIPNAFGSMSSQRRADADVYAHSSTEVNEDGTWTNCWNADVEKLSDGKGTITLTQKGLYDIVLYPVEGGASSVYIYVDGQVSLPAAEEKPIAASRNQSLYQTTSFETIHPLGYFDPFATEHRANYKLENPTAGVDAVDIAVIPCVLGAHFDSDGSEKTNPDKYYPLPIIRIQKTLEPGEIFRDYFSPQWGWEASLLKYVVIKLDPGDMELLNQNGIGGTDSNFTYHPSGRTPEANQRASDFMHSSFASYLE